MTSEPDIRIEKCGDTVIVHVASEPMPRLDLAAMLEKSIARAGRRLRNGNAPANQPKPVVRRVKVRRNAPCVCGSGKKFKLCCLNAAQSEPRPSGGSN